MGDDSLLIDENTLAVAKVLSGEYLSKIYTTNGIFYSKLSVEELLNRACISYMSTKKGREQATRLLLRFDKKPPFIISPPNIGAVPTASPKHPDCVYLFSRSFQVIKETDSTTRVKFSCGVSIVVKASVHTVLHQQQRLHMLLSFASMIKREKRSYHLHSYLQRERNKDQKDT